VCEGTDKGVLVAGMEEDVLADACSVQNEADVNEVVYFIYERTYTATVYSTYYLQVM
jgi:hypothetical protein